MTIAITDVVLRDAHQSLFATRLRLDDMLPIAAARAGRGVGAGGGGGGAG
ncbi:oxaloacetate decarboxylase, partial [Salmonella enterica subsp. enterica serovar Enteritidis]